MKTRLLDGLAILVLVLLPVLPRALDGEPAWVFESLLLVLFALVVPRSWHRLALVLGTSLLWSGLLIFEVLMAAGRYTTYEDPVLYDGIQLVWHLGVLITDLYGKLWTGGGLLGLGVLTGLGCFFAYRAFDRLFQTGGARVGVGILVPLVAAGIWLGPFSSTTLFVDRLNASIQLYQRVQALTQTEAYALHRAVKTKRKPDVRIYILESYGMTTYRSPFARSWPRRVSAQADRMRKAGWSLAAFRSLAPTAGGRSWICDAAVLTGRPLRFQAEYQALTGQADQIDHLPGWFATNGYQTLLARPSDRARPGVALQNRFGFEDTVFFKDLEYRGRSIGWGRIPDQYTVGWLEENRFNSERPQFSFTHLATAHFPWKPIPTFREDWHSYNVRETLTPAKKSRAAKTELWWVAHAFRREAGDHAKIPKRTVSLRASRNYLDALEHGLRAIVDELVKIPPDRPTLVLIMGDHQPAFIAQRGKKDVPLHIASNDPDLIKEFLEEGAVVGWRPREAVIHHPSLFSRLVRTLARYDQQPALPPLLETGVAL